jgi:protein subunit release factor A
VEAKNLLFSLTSKDFDFSFFAVGGNGGGGKDTSNTGARCTHHPSGSTATSTETRSQRKNKETAFKRCAETPVFKSWHKIETMRRLGQIREIESIVDKQMAETNLKVEYGS